MALRPSISNLNLTRMRVERGLNAGKTRIGVAFNSPSIRTEFVFNLDGKGSRCSGLSRGPLKKDEPINQLSL